MTPLCQGWNWKFSVAQKPPDTKLARGSKWEDTEAEEGGPAEAGSIIGCTAPTVAAGCLCVFFLYSSLGLKDALAMSGM